MESKACAPFFVLEGRDVMFCRSLKDLELFVEPPDANDTMAFDATGRIVTLTMVEASRSAGLLGKLAPRGVITKAILTSTRDPETLEAALKQYLALRHANVEEMTLSEIVANLDRFGVSWS